MNFKPLKFASGALTLLVAMAGCSGGDMVWGTGAAEGSTIARGANMTSAESIATGAPTGTIITATTFVIARHVASARQRQVAETRARKTYHRMITQRPEHHAAGPEKITSAHAAGHEKMTGAHTAIKAQPPLPRYIAVDTVSDERTSPKAKKSVMIWDTQSEQVVGKDVYDVQAPPPVGSTARFDTYSAEYVGAGS